MNTPADTKVTIGELFNQALAHHKQGRPLEAEKCYRAILQAHPRHAAANHNLGVLACQLGRIEAGVPYLRAALELDPKAGQHWLSYATALLQTGQGAQAIEVLQSAKRSGLNMPAADELLRRAEVAVHHPSVSNKQEPLPKEFEPLARLFHAGRLADLEYEARSLLKRYPQSGTLWKVLGAALQMQGKDGVPALQQAVQFAPNDAEAHNNLGLALHQHGELAAALERCRRALQIKPNFVEAHSNVGNILRDIGELGAAAASYRQALDVAPDYAEAHCNLGNVFLDQGRYDEAIECYGRAAQLKPNLAAVHNNLANALKAIGRLDEAERHCRHAIELKADYAEAHNTLGNILKVAGRLDEAVSSYGRALERRPDYAEAQSNLGNVLLDLGRFDEAIANYRRAIELKGDSAEMYCNLGSALLDRGRSSDAANVCRRALELKPNFADAANLLGNALQDLGQLEDAAEVHRLATELKADFADAFNNLGIDLKLLGRLEDAVATYRRSLALKPQFADAHSNLGNALLELGKLDEAIESHRKALEFKPDYAKMHSNLLYALNYHPDKSPEEIFAAYREFDASVGALYRGAWRPHHNSRGSGRRLKVGYVSPDFRQHSVRFFLEPLLARHNKEEVEVFAYADLLQEDAVTTRYKSYVENWISIAGLTDEMVANRIRDDRIDILVDLAGHTARNRLGVFARKPAPVSLSWLGYGYTTGLSAIDYLLTDAVSVPPGSEHLFAEKPWRIAVSSYVYRPAEGMGQVSALPALTNGYVTFGTLSRALRINYRVVRAWSKVLHAVDNSRLVIDSGCFKDAAMQEEIAGKFAANGIGRDRLVMDCHTPPWDVLRSVDVALDCFPHNSGTTLFESLYLGLPFISLLGRPSVGRISGSILHGLGRTEWIARNEDEYVEKTIALASDLPRLAEIRARLRSEMEQSALMDEQGFACKVEQAYRAMFESWCSTEPRLAGVELLRSDAK